MGRKLFIAATGALSLAFTFVGAASSANATEDTSPKIGYNVMLYRLKDFKGGYWNASAGSLSGESWLGIGASGHVDDSASSFDNSGPAHWYFYDAESCTGTSYHAQPYSEDADLSSNSGNPSNFDNRISCLNWG